MIPDIQDLEWQRAEDDGFHEPPPAEEELNFNARPLPPEGREPRRYINILDDPPKEYDDLGGPDR